MRTSAQRRSFGVGKCSPPGGISDLRHDGLEEARAATDPRLKAFLAEMAQEWQRLVEEAKGERGKRDFRGPEEDPGD
jgi:hypothetical protein